MAVSLIYLIIATTFLRLQQRRSQAFSLVNLEGKSNKG